MYHTSINLDIDSVKFREVNQVNSTICFISGHIFSVFMLYFNHRFILHGFLGKMKLLKRARYLHALHHKNAYTERESIRTPISITVILAVMICIVMKLQIFCGLGIASAWLYYEVMHNWLHGGGRFTKLGRLHETHHRRPHKNFSGIHPWLDVLFGTAE